MENAPGFIEGFFGGGPQLMLALLVFLAAGTLTFSVMAGVRGRGEVKRRAAGIAHDTREHHTTASSASRSLRQSSLDAAKRVLDYTTKHYSTADTKDMKVLRRRPAQAGYSD